MSMLGTKKGAVNFGLPGKNTMVIWLKWCLKVEMSCCVCIRVGKETLAKWRLYIPDSRVLQTTQGYERGPDEYILTER